MGNILCCGDSYLPIEERYNSHHRTYNEDPLLPSYANNTKYNYHNSRNVIKYTCSVCTFQHTYDFEICEMCKTRKNKERTILSPEETEERRQKMLSAAETRADKQIGSSYEKKLKEKEKKLKEYEKKNKEIGGENHLRWSR